MLSSAVSAASGLSGCSHALLLASSMSMELPECMRLAAEVACVAGELCCTVDVLADAAMPCCEAVSAAALSEKDAPSNPDFFCWAATWTDRPHTFCKLRHWVGLPALVMPLSHCATFRVTW